MLKDRTETEYHLTPQGWLKGSFWVCGAKIEDGLSFMVSVDQCPSMLVDRLLDSLWFIRRL